jgi:putative heme-binding domain-containing protein
MPAKGDAEAGRQVFRKTCAACHQLEDQGHAVGPDLLTTTDKPTDWFLTAILDPNRAVEDRYVEYQARTADGRTVSGLLAAETGVSITLRAAEGKEETVPRRDLESLLSTGRSPMPDGLEKDVSPKAMADLLAYLASLRPRPADRR